MIPAMAGPVIGLPCLEITAKAMAPTECQQAEDPGYKGNGRIAVFLPGWFGSSIRLIRPGAAAVGVILSVRRLSIAVRVLSVRLLPIAIWGLLSAGAGLCAWILGRILPIVLRVWILGLVLPAALWILILGLGLPVVLRGLLFGPFLPTIL